MPDYQHHWKDGTPVHLPLGKIVCIGRNYAEHARELNNPVPDEPLLFIKPATSAVHITRPLDFPRNQGAVHFETELAVLIGRPLTNASASDAEAAILGYGLALDLTLRDVQSRLKEKGQPWERAKAFDGAAVCSDFVPLTGPLDALALTLHVDDELRQQGEVNLMLYLPEVILSSVQRTISLEDGDLILTGTPAGVGPVVAGQRFRGSIRAGGQTLVSAGWTARE